MIPDGWKSMPLGTIGKFTKGAGISKAEVLDSGYSAVRYGELYTSHHVVVKEIKSFISEDSKKKSRRIKYGDILFAGSGETAEEIGKSAVYLGTDEAYAGGDIIVFTPNESDPMFLAYLLNSQEIRKHLWSRGQGQSVVHIYATELSKLPLDIPPLPE
ncbi:MAG TPA: restriction endonuclease subunit S, partial [bacterium]